MEEVEGLLSLVSTPIGNLSDLSDRARETLIEAEGWIVEDTRVSGKLGQVLGVKKPMKILNDHTSPPQVERYAQEIKAGKRYALLTDGGAPSISDPGALLVDCCYKVGAQVDSLPGPSAVINALGLSGFFAQRFVFLGFLGRKAGDIRKELTPFIDSPLTLVLFESLQRLDTLLEVAGGTLGTRRYALCREMTKTHQQVFRNQLPTIPTEDDFPRKGELTVVIEGLRRTTASF